MGVKKIRFPDTSGIGIKPVSSEGTERLTRKAIQYAIDNDRRSVTIVHKGNIMKFTEGGFPRLELRDRAARVRPPQPIDGGPWCKFKNPKSGREIIVKDVIADAFLQQILLRPDEYDVITTLNLNGDYISDALAAEVGGIGIAPGANLSDTVAMFEATHGTAPKVLPARTTSIRLGNPLRRNDAGAHGLEGSREAHHDESRKSHRRQGCDLRFRAAHAGRDAGFLLGLRQGHDRADVTRRDGREQPGSIRAGREVCCVWPTSRLVAHDAASRSKARAADTRAWGLARATCPCGQAYHYAQVRVRRQGSGRCSFDSS
jgi:hypothetical protein